MNFVDPVVAAVAQALKASGGDRAKAVRALEEKVRRDRALRDRILEPLIRRACEDAIGVAIRKERRNSWSPPRPPALSTDRERVSALARGTLMMFRLPTPGCRPLRDATREEIAEAIRFCEAQSQDMAFKAHWLRLVSSALPDGMVVRHALTEARLRELQREASRCRP